MYKKLILSKLIPLTLEILMKNRRALKKAPFSIPILLQSFRKASLWKMPASDTRGLEENQQTKDQLDILWGGYTAQVMYSFALNQP